MCVCVCVCDCLECISKSPPPDPDPFIQQFFSISYEPGDVLGSGAAAVSKAEQDSPIHWYRCPLLTHREKRGHRLVNSLLSALSGNSAGSGAIKEVHLRYGQQGTVFKNNKTD